MENTAYDFIMRASMSHDECSLFALVDGLQYERHFDEEIPTEKNVTAPFFNIWPDSRIAFAGPWLIRLNTSVRHRERLKELSMALPAVSWILTSLSLDDLVTLLKPLLNLQLPNGRIALYRFYDPRVLVDIELVLDESNYAKIIRNVCEWVFSLDGELKNLKDSYHNSTYY